MTFDQFAAAHGVIVGRIIPGKWQRCPTTDKPRHRNGAVKHMGTWALVQNWATQTEPSIWRAEGDSTSAQRRVAEVARQANREASVAAQKAAQKAEDMLAECELVQHPYFASKGFPDERVNVWKKDEENIALIPMRAAGRVVGAQCVAPDGDKKFLYGQRSSNAEFVFGTRGMDVLCEGYATGLSVIRVMQALKVQARVHVGFSAGNLKKLAPNLPIGIVVADNDKSLTGQKVAEEIGWPYWISDQVAEDFNDCHQRIGLFAIAMQFKKVLMTAQKVGHR